MICVGCLIPFVFAFLLVRIRQVISFLILLWSKLRAANEKPGKPQEINTPCISKRPGEKMTCGAKESISDFGDPSFDGPLPRRSDDSDSEFSLVEQPEEQPEEPSIDSFHTQWDCAPMGDYTPLERFGGEGWAIEDDPSFDYYKIIFRDAADLFD